MPAPAEGCPPGFEWVEEMSSCAEKCGPNEERNQYGDCEGKDPMGASRQLIPKDVIVGPPPKTNEGGRRSRSRKFRRSRKARKVRKTRRS